MHDLVYLYAVRPPEEHPQADGQRSRSFWPLVVRCCTVTYNLTMTSMSASEARAALPELLNRVEGGEEVTITRHGHPVAVLVRPDSLRARRAGGAG